MKLTDINEIRALGERHDFRFSKSKGQNFLIADWVPRRIADSAGLGAGWGVVEVGPGVGCLTEQLSMHAERVVSIELDKSLKPILAETLKERQNVDIIFADALKTDFRELCRERLPGLRCAVCANLPYNVTSPLLTAFIEAGCFESITVMIQREVAKRICAAPGCADYGAFGIFVQWHMETELLFDVPPSCFIPQPKVTSSVIRLKKRAKAPAEVQDEALMFRIVRAAFNMRRKTFVNALCSQFGNITKENAAEALRCCGHDERVRGEVLSIGDFAKISDKIGALIANNL